MRWRRSIRAGWKAALATGALASIGGGWVKFAKSEEPPACRQGDLSWTRPTVLPGPGVARPEMTVGEAPVYAFGAAPPERSLASRNPPAIFVLNGGADRVGAPSEAVGFYDPIFAADRTGTLHAVWAEDQEGAVSDPAARFKQLWLTRVLYAQYRAGRWGRASVIYRAPKIPWRRPLISHLAVDGSGGLHFAFTAQRLTSVPPLVHLKSEAQGWRATEWTEWLRPSPRHQNRSVIDSIIPADGGIYPALATGWERRLYLTFLSPARFASGAPIPGGDSNSLWVKRSDDGGESWGEPILVHRSGPRGAYEPHIVAVGRDTVHVLWQQDLDEAPGPDALWHAISTDGGGTWSKADAIPLDGRSPFRNTRATAAPNGDLYVAFMSAPARGARGEQIFYARRHGSAWSAPRPLRSELPVSGFDLAMDGAGRLHLLWSLVGPVQLDQRGTVDRSVQYAVGSPCQVEAERIAT